MTNADKPAFARAGVPEYWDPQIGLTKREYFAAKAMEGLCADRHHSDTQGNPKALAALAVECADALLEELSKVENHG